MAVANLDMIELSQSSTQCLLLQPPWVVIFRSCVSVCSQGEGFPIYITHDA